MNNAAFKTQFNTLYNNINNNAAPGLSDAEISIFLNKAQNEIVKSHTLGPTTVYQLGVNQTSKRDVELNTLIKTASYTASNGDLIHPHGTLCSISYNNNVPLIILSEVLKVGTSPNEINLDIVELSYTQFDKFMAGVYKYPKKNQCWKIRHDDKFEFIAPVGVTVNPTNIKQVYVKIPRQINVASSAVNDSCELPEVLHDEIVQRAVELAKAAYASQDVNIQMSMGQRSE